MMFSNGKLTVKLFTKIMGFFTKLNIPVSNSKVLLNWNEQEAPAVLDLACRNVTTEAYFQIPKEASSMFRNMKNLRAPI